MKKFKTILNICLFCITFGTAFSEPVFKLNVITDAVLAGTGIILSGSDLILDNGLKLNRCEYSGEYYEKKSVNSLNRFFMDSYSNKLDSAADLTVAAAMATPAFLLLGINELSTEDWFTGFVMYAETMLIANGVKELTKLCVTRKRPYMYYNSASWPKDDVDEGDFANSFPSGHSTMAFAGATFTSYTFCKHFPESKWRIPVIAGSYGLAFTTAALRIKSGNHFFTDVTAGALIGSGIGFLVPWLHTFNQKRDLNISLLPDGISFSYRF